LSGVVPVYVYCPSVLMLRCVWCLSPYVSPPSSLVLHVFLWLCIVCLSSCVTEEEEKKRKKKIKE